MNLYTLATLVTVARTLSPFYRDLYAHVPDNFTLQDLPVVDQKSYWAANTTRDNRLLTGPLQDGIVFKSGGTTGAPKFSIFSRSEWETFTQAFGEGLDAGGLRDGERIANLFYAGELYASFVFITDSINHARASALQFPVSGKADFAVIAHTVQDFDIDAIAGTPTTLVNLAEHLIGTQARLESVGRLLYGGESLYPDQLDTLRLAFPNARAASIGYASVDAGLLGYADQHCGPDEHRVFSRYTLLEILDEDTGEPIREAGRAGRIVITNLTRLLMPVIRYPAGDRGMWLEDETAADRKFRILGRSEEGARVGPVTLYVEDVWHVLDPFRHILQIANFQMVVTHHAQRDQLTLKIAAHGSPQDLELTRQALADAIYEARPMFAQLLEQGLVHPLHVEWVGVADLAINPRTGKLKRVLDLRHEQG